jgi:hypothetical protein
MPFREAGIFFMRILLGWIPPPSYRRRPAISSLGILEGAAA